MRKFLLLLMATFFSVTVIAQRERIPDSVAYVVIQKAQRSFPKFYKEFESIKIQDTLIRNIVFIEDPRSGPAFASPNGTIMINLEFLKNRKPAFDDNRLIVVLYHEVGHLHYFVTTERSERNPENSEKAAFEYSLLKTKELAEKNDCMPLITGLRFMKQRSESNDLEDPHVRALKRMVNEPLYSEYVRYVNSKCKN